MNPFNLFADEKTGKFSSAKFWLHAGCGALTYALLRTELTPELVLAYGSVVVGNNVAIQWIKKKYGNAPTPAQE